MLFRRWSDWPSYIILIKSLHIRSSTPYPIVFFHIASISRDHVSSVYCYYIALSGNLSWLCWCRSCDWSSFPFLRPEVSVLYARGVFFFYMKCWTRRKLPSYKIAYLPRCCNYKSPCNSYFMVRKSRRHFWTTLKHSGTEERLTSFCKWWTGMSDVKREIKSLLAKTTAEHLKVASSSEHCKYELHGR